MNLRLRRLVRTSSSEQYAIFDLDQVEGEDGAPATIGKLDLHYTAEGLYGTLLLWDEETRKLADEQREEIVYALLDELSMPMGVPNEYVVEFFTPELDNYSVFHNVGLADEDDASAPDDASASEDDVSPDEQGVDGVDTDPAPGARPESMDKSSPEAARAHQPVGASLPDFDVKPVE